MKYVDKLKQYVGSIGDRCVGMEGANWFVISKRKASAYSSKIIEVGEDYVITQDQSSSETPNRTMIIPLNLFVLIVE